MMLHREFSCNPSLSIIPDWALLCRAPLGNFIHSESATYLITKCFIWFLFSFFTTGSEMANSGSKMAKSESEMAESGSEMAKLGSEMANLGSEMAKLGSEMA